jgi:hypothetical protein
MGKQCCKGVKRFFGGFRVGKTAKALVTEGARAGKKDTLAWRTPMMRDGCSFGFVVRRGACSLMAAALV